MTSTVRLSFQNVLSQYIVPLHVYICPDILRPCAMQKVTLPITTHQRIPGDGTGSG